MGVEPTASTLRIQTGLFPDLGNCGYSQLDGRFGKPLATATDPYSPFNRARIAHETVGNDVETWVMFGNLGSRDGRKG